MTDGGGAHAFSGEYGFEYVIAVVELSRLVEQIDEFGDCTCFVGALEGNSYAAGVQDVGQFHVWISVVLVELVEFSEGGGWGQRVQDKTWEKGAECRARASVFCLLT